LTILQKMQADIAGWNEVDGRKSLILNAGIFTLCIFTF